MDYEALVNEILTRVLAKLEEIEAKKTSSQSASSNTSSCCCKTEATQFVAKDLKKRVVTERDVKTAAAEGVTRINVCENTILTDLAREYAAKSRIEIVKG